MRPYITTIPTLLLPLSPLLCPKQRRGAGGEVPYAGTRSATSRGSVMRPVMAEAMATAGLAR